MMEGLGLSVNEVRRLLAIRGVLLKIIRGPKPDKELIDWLKRGGIAEVIRLDDFRTCPGCGCRPGASGS
jgi:hypothetical protein